MIFTLIGFWPWALSNQLNDLSRYFLFSICRIEVCPASYFKLFAPSWMFKVNLYFIILSISRNFSSKLALRLKVPRIAVYVVCFGWTIKHLTCVLPCPCGICLYRQKIYYNLLNITSSKTTVGWYQLTSKTCFLFWNSKLRLHLLFQTALFIYFQYICFHFICIHFTLLEFSSFFLCFSFLLNVLKSSY